MTSHARWPAGLAALLCLATAAPLWAAEVPPLRGRVNDYAGVLSGNAVAAMDRRLAAYESTTGQQFAVLWMPALGDDTPEDFAVRVFESWKLGKAKEDNGVLLLVVGKRAADGSVSPEGRSLRIEVGYGLEDRITDALSSQIIQNILKPAFKRNDYNGGIDQALTALMQAGSGHAVGAVPRARGPVQQQPVELGGGSLLLIILCIVGAVWVMSHMGGGRGGGFGGGFGGGGFGGGGGGWGGGGGGGFSGGGGGSGGGGASGDW